MTTESPVLEYLCDNFRNEETLFAKRFRLDQFLGRTLPDLGDRDAHWNALYKKGFVRKADPVWITLEGYLAHRPDGSKALSRVLEAVKEHQHTHNFSGEVDAEGIFSHDKTGFLRAARLSAQAIHGFLMLLELPKFPVYRDGAWGLYEHELRIALAAENLRDYILKLRDKGTESPSNDQRPASLQHDDEPPESDDDSMPQPDTKQVFVIHGRNLVVKNAVEQFIRALDLQVLEFETVAADCGTAFIGEIVRVGMTRAQGIVAVFSPDEFSTLDEKLAIPSDAREDLYRWQARPNVIFEAGMAYGLAPKRTVIAVLGGETALFSDLKGVHITTLSNSQDSRQRLRQKLIGAGCAVNERTTAWLDPKVSGDFDAAKGYQDTPIYTSHLRPLVVTDSLIEILRRISQGGSVLVPEDDAAPLERSGLILKDMQPHADGHGFRYRMTEEGINLLRRYDVASAGAGRNVS